MTPEQREQAVIAILRGQTLKTGNRGMVEALVDLLAEERRAGAEQAWDEGWRAGGKHQFESSMYRDSLHGTEIDPPERVDNPYRADQQGQP